ncbi:hypothetical protein [Nocardioides aurantiacus]|uniref:hypothetical protein n=1 Tax=Nocardioides aurantiacus TaxID=86796 RepID=UPI0011CD7F79|nr:hypothetical protein [Nocardioides aurantiacus]
MAADPQVGPVDTTTHGDRPPDVDVVEAHVDQQQPGERLDRGLGAVVAELERLAHRPDAGPGPHHPELALQLVQGYAAPPHGIDRHDPRLPTVLTGEVEGGARGTRHGDTTDDVLVPQVDARQVVLDPVLGAAAADPEASDVTELVLRPQQRHAQGTGRRVVAEDVLLCHHQVRGEVTQ